MGILWPVIALDPDEPQIVEWLQEHGYEVGNLRGRYPTLDELLDALTFIDPPVRSENDRDNGWSIWGGDREKSNFVQIIGSIEDENAFHFCFEKSGNEEPTMLEILKRLSDRCGALIIFDDISATPLLVTPDIEINAAIKDWHRRQGYDD